VLIPIGVAARELGLSRERLSQLVRAGRVDVVRDSLGRRFLEDQELTRIREQRESQRQAARS